MGLQVMRCSICRESFTSWTFSGKTYSNASTPRASGISAYNIIQPTYIKLWIWLRGSSITEVLSGMSEIRAGKLEPEEPEDASIEGVCLHSYSSSKLVYLFFGLDNT